MTMLLLADRSLPIPYPVMLIVTCDGDHGLLPAPVAEFDASHGHPRDPALRSGWKFSPDGLVMCPDCARRR